MERATQINVAAEHVVITGGENSGQTIIEGGKINGSLIDIDTLFAQLIELKDDGVIQSAGYNDAATKGFMLKSDGTAEFRAMRIYGEATFVGKTVEARATLRLPLVYGTPSDAQIGDIWLNTAS